MKKTKFKYWEAKLKMKFCWVLRARGVNGFKEVKVNEKKMREKKKYFWKGIKQGSKLVQIWSNFKKTNKRVVYAILQVFWLICLTSNCTTHFTKLSSPILRNRIILW